MHARTPHADHGALVGAAGNAGCVVTAGCTGGGRGLICAAGAVVGALPGLTLPGIGARLVVGAAVPRAPAGPVDPCLAGDGAGVPTRGGGGTGTGVTIDGAMFIRPPRFPPVPFVLFPLTPLSKFSRLLLRPLLKLPRPP